LFHLILEHFGAFWLILRSTKTIRATILALAHMGKSIRTKIGGRGSGSLGDIDQRHGERQAPIMAHAGDAVIGGYCIGERRGTTDKSGNISQTSSDP
jgi:hypothetical protein